MRIVADHRQPTAVTDPPTADTGGGHDHRRPTTITDRRPPTPAAASSLHADR